MKARAVSASISWLLCFCLTVPAMAQSNAQTPAAPAPPAATDPTTNTNPAADSAALRLRTDTPRTAHGTPPGVKPGSKNDVDAIGNRNVGGRGLGDWYSTDTEMKMGKQYAMMVEQTARMIQDPVINEYVNRIGQNLVRNSDAKVPFTIKVIDSDEINAFALPGGFFYVNSGLILAADEEAELAGVMAHEIAHVAARHAMQQMTRMQYASLATIPLMFVGSWGIYEAASMAINLALPITFMKFSRDFESQADYLGLQYMYKAGYDPQAFVSFFEKIEAKDKKKPGTDREGVCVASADPGPHRKGAGRDQANSAQPSRNTLSIPRSSTRSRRGWRRCRTARRSCQRPIPTSRRCAAPLRTTITTGRRSSRRMIVRRFRGATTKFSSRSRQTGG